MTKPLLPPIFRPAMTAILESLYPKKQCCAFCGRYWHGSKLSAGLCPSCLLEWRRFRQGTVICPLCGSFDSGDPCQGPCADGIDGVSDRLGGLSAIYASVPYTGMYRQRIMAFKYNGAKQMAMPFGFLMAEAWREGQNREGQNQMLPRNDRPPAFLFPRRKASQTVAPCLVPVPMHPEKEKLRGYNQSRLLAEAVSGETGFHVAELLRRSQMGQMQAGLDKTHRKTSLDQVFQWREQSKQKPGPAIIVDDVVTTGATLECCAQLLLRQGYGPVWGLTFGGGSGWALRHPA